MPNVDINAAAHRSRRQEEAVRVEGCARCEVREEPADAPLTHHSQLFTMRRPLESRLHRVPLPVRGEPHDGRITVCQQPSHDLDSISLEVRNAEDGNMPPP